jgi:AraC-like DNA-binding protein
MKLDFSWINLLILFGAFQGLIFSIVLLFNRKHPGAKFLSVFMFVLAYNGFETFNWSGGLDQYIVFFELFSFVVIYALGPSLYLYITTLLYPDQRLSRKKIFAHYAIVGFQFVYRFVIFVIYILWKVYDIKTEFAPTLMGIFWLYAEPLSVIVFLTYLVASVNVFRKARGQTNAKFGSKEGHLVTYQWIKALLGCMIVMGIIWPLTVLAPHFFELPFGPHYYPIELGLVFFIYWIAFAGYYHTKLIYPQVPKWLSNTISASEARQYLTQLQHAMEHDKLYLDPELNLKKVADHTGISPKIISTILNQHFRQSFNDFINAYRVREVKERLLDPENRHMTISGVALESGFNSQATFQRVFKNVTGTSPREYLALQMKKTG